MFSAVRPTRGRLTALFAALVVVVAMQPAVAELAEPTTAQSVAFSAGRMENGELVGSTPAEYAGEPLTVQTSYVGRPAAEPTIGVDKKGNAFYAAGAFDGPLNPKNPFDESQTIPTAPRTFVMRSTNGGTDWKNVSPMVPGTDNPVPPVTADPMVYVDEDTGRVFNPELYAGCTWMNISDDQGKSWIANPLACGNFVNDHQTVVTAPPSPNLKPLMTGYPNVMYYCFNRVVDSNCGRSLDGGLTFTPTPTPAFFGYDPAAGGLCGGLHGHVAGDSEGRLFLPKGHCGSPWSAVTEDGGTTWNRVKVSDEVSAAGTHLAVATDDADNVYFVWWDKERRLPWMAVSTDHGKTFSDPMMIAPPGVNEVNFPVVTAGSEGRVAITFPGTTSSDRNDAKRPWNHYMVMSTDANSAAPTFLATTANDPSDPVHRGACGPGRCGALWDFEDIVVSPADGRFWAAVADGCTTVEGCNSPDGAAPGILEMPVGEGMAVRQMTGPSLRVTEQEDGPKKDKPKKPRSATP